MSERFFFPHRLSSSCENKKKEQQQKYIACDRIASEWMFVYSRFISQSFVNLHHYMIAMGVKTMEHSMFNHRCTFHLNLTLSAADGWRLQSCNFLRQNLNKILWFLYCKYSSLSVDIQKRWIWFILMIFIVSERRRRRRREKSDTFPHDESKREWKSRLFCGAWRGALDYERERELFFNFCTVYVLRFILTGGRGERMEKNYTIDRHTFICV